ncbi:hypothetical protein QYE76_046797 [Lolium multiflorum]|uniref:Uncharacterized protein n=1 Tax=Lolium multiflorum TaxID=4521 RepID=A0AAD8TQJ8_LOLMU|nr:hypothetical protein QYE76_046797 [Lolium multiflorum]
MARRISKLVSEGLTRMDLTLSWFTRRIQPLRYNRRLICAYTGVDDPLRVTKDSLPADSLNKSIRTLLNTLAEEDFGEIFRIVAADSGKGDDAPEEEEDEEEEEPEKIAPRPSKLPRGKSSRVDAAPSAEGPVKKPKTAPTKAPPHMDSKRAERERIKMLATSGKGAWPKLPGSAPQKVVPPPEAEKWELEQDLLNAMLNDAWSKADSQSYEIEQHKRKTCEFLDELLVKRTEQQALHYELHKTIALQRRVSLRQAEHLEDEKEKVAALEKKLEENQAEDLKSSLESASSELASLRSTHKDLESKLTEAESKQKMAVDQLAEKSSDFDREKAELQVKREKDADIIKKLQTEVNSLRSYMSQAEAGWDLLNSEVFGYNEERREQFTREDLIKLAEDDCRDLISAARKICYNLALKDSRKCDVRELIEKMALLPELVVDLQASSARGAAQIALAMCLGWNSTLDLDQATTAIPKDSDPDALLDACSGYDMRITRRIPHDEFYDKVVLPADEPLEAELLKKAESEKKPAGSGEESDFTWTSSKEAEKKKPHAGEDASSPAP